MAGGWFSQAGRIKQWWVTGMRVKQPFQAVINLDLKEGPLDGLLSCRSRERMSWKLWGSLARLSLGSVLS